ncbi:MAG: GDP-L-fucose synthase [Oscillospiraceae bacterium]|jgi:GDP-L-fucose synthase|nr:GDP-L-fucose synthase [Oscillospiraceae bacterium]
MVGSALVRGLKRHGYQNIVTRTHRELDLTNQAAATDFFENETPEYVFLAAAKVGGIYANSAYPADFIMENMQIQCNVIRSAYRNRVKKLMLLGSSCIYPKLCPQPIQEEYLLTGALEPTNEAYALAKISGIKMCQSYNRQYGTDYISVMPASLYGPYDRFDLNNSHVIPSMIMKFYRAKAEKKPYVELWGTGKPLREFLYVDDMAEACIGLMERYDGNDFLNIGSGKEISIRDLAETIRKTAGFEGGIRFDCGKPDGTPRRVLDNSKILQTGWKPKVGMEEGIRREYQYFLDCIAPRLKF